MLRQECKALKGLLIAISTMWFLSLAIHAYGMPAQVMIIRHAEKYQDRKKINLNPRGLTRARALAQFFQSDPRVLAYGLPEVIIAQSPSKKKKSVRCEETVQPLAQALGREIISQFEYGKVADLVTWVKTCRECDSKSVLICAQHEDIVAIARTLGAPDVRQIFWPHETFDRVWLIDFSSKDGSVSSFKDIPQKLLFGDSFQEDSRGASIGSLNFYQDYFESTDNSKGEKSPITRWKCRIIAEAPGDFSNFDEETIPILRLGGFTFGYYATTLGNMRKDQRAKVQTDASNGSGFLKYDYKAVVEGVDQTYAWVTFSWDKERLRAEFEADVDESKLVPELSMPVEFRQGKGNGSITGVTSCCLGFGDKRFDCPAGLPYQGVGEASQKANGQEYRSSVSNNNGIIVLKRYLPEL